MDIAPGSPAPLDPPTGWTEVTEGGTPFLIPLRSLRGASSRGPAHRAPVFYNRAMALSRDLHVAVVKALAGREGRRLTVWDMLSASGIRGLRALHETSSVEHLLATDLHPQAVAAVAENLRRLGATCGEARRADALAVPAEAPFDLVDLDPYGSPVPFLESALAAVRPGGVLAVTATDMAVLAGPERAACEKRYGARPLRTYLCREAGLRILLARIAHGAGERGREVHPLLTYVRDHHARAYLRLDPRKGGTATPSRTVPYDGYDGPPIPPGRKGGPLWTGPLHDRTFVEQLELPTSPAAPRELERWTRELREEAGLDVLFYYASGELGRRLAWTHPPPLPDVMERLRRAGWKAARTPFDPSGWRTDAPWPEVERLLRSAGGPAGRSDLGPGAPRTGTA